MHSFWWIHIVFGLLAIGSGAFVLNGILRVALSGARVVRFLQYSLVAALAGIWPATRHHSSLSAICMASVYCSGAVFVTWHKFRLAGLWRMAFVFLILAVLYLDIVSVSSSLCEGSHLWALLCARFGKGIELTQLAFTLAFAVLGALALRIHRNHMTR